MTHFTDPFENLPSRVKPSSTFGTTEVSDVFADGLFADGLFASGLFGSTLLGTTITNANATDGVGYYEIDDRTGFKLYPAWHPLSKAKEDGYGWRTVNGDPRHPQEFVKSRGNDKATGPQFAEPDPVYISTSVSPEDL